MSETKIDWSAGTFRGARREQLRHRAALIFRQRMTAMEDLGELARFSLEEKRQRGLPYFDPHTGELVVG